MICIKVMKRSVPTANKSVTPVHQLRVSNAYGSSIEASLCNANTVYAIKALVGDAME